MHETWRFPGALWRGSEMTISDPSPPHGQTWTLQLPPTSVIMEIHDPPLLLPYLPLQSQEKQ